MHLFIDILRNSVLITGLVVVMMMMIESLNIESRGMLFKGLRRTKVGQVVVAALLGSVPGCMGGFATVSLYTHRMFSFGALVAMMIASSGDEAFVMLAMIPEQALVIFAVGSNLVSDLPIIIPSLYTVVTALLYHFDDATSSKGSSDVLSAAGTETTSVPASIKAASAPETSFFSFMIVVPFVVWFKILYLNN